MDFVKVLKNSAVVKIMARIIEGERRLIKMSADDVISIVREYQQVTRGACCYDHVRELLKKANIFIPEETF